MADLGEELLLALSTFGAKRIADAAEGEYADPAALIGSLFAATPPEFEQKRAQLESDVREGLAKVRELSEAVAKHLAKIRTLAQLAQAEADAAGFDTDRAGQVAGRVAAVLMLIDVAVRPVANELSKDPAGTVRKAVSDQLVADWNPWVKPFEKLQAEAAKVIDLAGDLVGIEDAGEELAKRVTWDAPNRRLTARVGSVDARELGPIGFSKSTLELFLAFSETEVTDPTEDEKATLVEVDGKWFAPDETIMGARVRTTIEPGLLSDPLLKNLLGGSTAKPKAKQPTVVTVDSADGLHLGEHGAKEEKAVLPVGLSFPGVELREVTLGLTRNDTEEITGFELYMMVAASLGGVVAFQVAGVGAVITMEGTPSEAAMFDLPVSPRKPDRVGLRLKTEAVKGGGYLEKVTRTYDGTELVEYGGVVQLEILKAGVYAVGILSPDPFSLVLVMGVRFPKAIELGYGFTFNGIGGILAVNRTVDTAELIKGVQSGLLTRLLFPDDPVAEAPTLLNQVAKVFPPRDGGFVIGPIIELGWGSEARIIEAKIGVALALPEPKVLILGAVRVRAPSKVTPLTDLQCEVLGEITGDRLLIVATLRDSTIAGIRVSGDLGLLIQWGGDGDFALSVGGFHPRYLKVPADLTGLERVTMDLSPVKGGPVTLVVKVYLAVTAGAIMAGIRGDLKAKLGPASAHAWAQLDVIFYWVPRFGFAADLELGLSVEVWGHSFASVRFRGVLAGTTPWQIEGTGEIDVWFLPTIPLDLGPYTWGQPAGPGEVEVSPLGRTQSGLSAEEAWRVVPPLDQDLLVALGTPEAPAGGLLAHPLGILEVTQSSIPLETHLDRVGSAPVSAHRVHLEEPTTSAGPVGAVSTVTVPFAPGQFLDLAGEALLARSGFEDLPGGCRIGSGTSPVHGTPQDASVRWRTWFRHDTDKPVEQDFTTAFYSAALVGHSLVARHLEEDGDNPYLTRVHRAQPGPQVTVDPHGTATVRAADDGDRVLEDLGLLSMTEAGRLADQINRSGAGHVVAVAAGAL